MFGYGASYLVSAGVMALAMPFVVLARREHASSDPITGDEEPAVPTRTPPRHRTTTDA